MEAREIFITPVAEEDIREIFDFLSDFSLNAALTQIDLILNQIELLKEFPKLGKVLPHLNNEHLREIIIGKYRVAYYIVSNEQIDILRIHRAGGAG